MVKEPLFESRWIVNLLKPKVRRRGTSDKSNGTQPWRTETRADVTNVKFAGPREAKSRRSRIKSSDVHALAWFMHDPGQGRTGMKFEFSTPESPNPLSSKTKRSVEQPTGWPTIETRGKYMKNAQGRWHYLSEINFQKSIGQAGP